MTYIQPPDHIELSDLDDFVASIPGSHHYTDKSIRALMVRLRSTWAAHFRRMYPEFAQYISKQKIELADDEQPKRAIRVSKRVAQKIAKKFLSDFEDDLDEKEMTRLSTASANIIRQALKRGVRVEIRRTGIKSDIDEDTAYEDYIDNQIGRLVRLTHETFRNEMQAYLIDAIRDGKEPADIADDITSHFQDFPRSKADRIARSEFRDAMNASTLIASEGAGIRYVRATDGTDFDQECRDRNGKLFTVKEAWRELRREHPYGTLGFDPVPRANFSVRWVEEMPGDAPDDSAGWFDDKSSTLYVFENDPEAERYIEAIADYLISNNDEDYVVSNGR
jgi:hypothetical protein